MNAKVLGNRSGFSIGQPGQSLFLLAKIEEQLALRLGRRNLHDAPVPEHKLVNLGTYPVHGKGHEAHVVIRVKALDRFHQSDVAFLDQVVQGQAIARISLGDVHDKTQMRHNEVAGGIEVLVVTQTVSKLLLVFLAEHRNGTDGLYIAIKTADRSGQGQVVVKLRYSACHRVPPLLSAILALKPLEC